MSEPRGFDLEKVKAWHREECDCWRSCPCDIVHPNEPHPACYLAAIIAELEAVPKVHELTGHPMVGWGKLCGGIIKIHDPIVFSANEGLVTCSDCVEKIDQRNASKPARSSDGRFAERGSD